MIKAVIFDLDNTLYDYDRCNEIAEKALYNAISDEFKISYGKAQDALKKAKFHVKENLGSEVAASHNRLLYMQDVCEQFGKNPLQYAMNFYNIYWDTMLSEMTLFGYAIPLIDGLRDKGIKVGILTDLTAHIQYRKIAALGLDIRIDYLVTSEEVGAEKPSEKMFHLMLKKMNVLPEEAIMIGDSQSKDIDGAMAVGLNAIKYEKGMDIYERTSALLG